MEHAKVRKLIKNKTKMITMRINPELLERLDEAIEKISSIPTGTTSLKTVSSDTLNQRQDLIYYPFTTYFFACYFSLNPLI